VLHELFSSTEQGLVASQRPADQFRKPGSVGLPFAFSETRIVTDDGRDCAVDEVGELFARSPFLFSGYWNRPEETAAAFKDGWVTVGDLARRDIDGYLYIVGRKKEMIISGGINVYPAEVEELLLTHPAIAEAAVVGIPDPKWGEMVKAFVVLKPGAALTESALSAFCSQRLAAYKVPKAMAVLDALPRNQSGKIVKGQLKSLP
jgi:long-chain acyl-CoA synthetase